MKNMRKIILFFLLLFLLLPQNTRAQDETSENYSENSLTERGFVAVDSSMNHQDTGMPYLITAYGFFFMIIFGYVVKLGRSQNELATKLHHMQRELTELENKLNPHDSQKS